MQRFQAACVHVCFFVLASHRAKVVAVTRTPFDRFGKQLVRDALEGRCSVETDAEVPADTRRIDLWVTPREASALTVEAPERRLALPVLPRLHLPVPADPAQQTSDDREF
jgi:hypothetical protein